MIQHIGNNRNSYYGGRTINKATAPKNTGRGFDKINISEVGRSKAIKTSTLSHEEKVANRRRIDFCNGSVSFDSGSMSFQLPDGTLIPMEDVAPDISEEEITSTIEVIDNKAELTPNTYGKWTAPDGKTHMVRVTENGVGLSSFVQYVFSNPAYNSQIVSEPPRTDITTQNTLTLLDLMSEDSTSGLSVYGIYMLYKDEDVTSILKNLGFKPGKIEVNIGEGSNVYFWDKKDGLYSGSQSESTIRATNSINFIDQHNVPQGAIYKIDGKEYPMDEDGFFHIPSGIMCLPNSMSLVDKDGNPIQLIVGGCRVK